MSDFDDLKAYLIPHSKVKILLLLATRDNPIGASKLRTDAGLSRDGFYNNIDFLLENNVVINEKDGVDSYYSLNESHPVANGFLTIVEEFETQ